MSRERTLAVSARSRTGANPRQPRTPGRVAKAAPLLLAPVLLLATVLVWSLHSAAHQAVTGLSAAIDPRLIIQPRIVAQTVQVGELRLTLTASSLVPGSNHFEVRLGDHGRPVDGARIRLIATMPEMAGSPLSYQTRAIGQGRYEVTCPLTMFGHWQIMTTVSRPGAAALRHAFGLSLDIPSGVLQAAAASNAQSR